MSRSTGLVRSPLRLLGAVLLCNAAGIAGALVTATGPSSWYETLAKPWFLPPPFVFAPVWTLLYVMMGIALYLIWMEGSDRPDVRRALSLFAVQLALNALWSPVFFGLQSPALGLVVILLLFGAVLLTVRQFLPVRKEAAWLLVPYCIWIAFATVLNTSILLLNA
ncbi:MAG: tryptophan-rich sensory protein [Methanomicrobiales archaeon]|nr:tryptophan-rich sensory protein [Methanomicrobiales archaeon]